MLLDEFSGKPGEGQKITALDSSQKGGDSGTTEASVVVNGKFLFGMVQVDDTIDLLRNG